MEFSEHTASWLHLDESNPDSGRLYVSTEHRASPAVQSEIARAMRLRPTLTLKPVHLSELRLLQLGRSGQASGSAWSFEQQQVVKFMKRAGEKLASDIHFIIGAGNITSVVFRIHGDLELEAELDVKEGMSLASTIVMSMCDVAPQAFSESDEQDGRLRNEFVEALGLYAARYSAVPTESGLYVVLRVIRDESDHMPTLDSLGYLPEQQRDIRRMLQRPEGIVITAGPTGSGKSTTMRTFCQMYIKLTDGRRRLVTVEDPVEGLVPKAVQTTILADRNNPESVTRAWQKRLSAFKRLDPDAIVVGEIRDGWSAGACFSEGKSGSLVLSTLHANDATGIVDRLTDTLDIPPGMVMDSQVVIGLIAQRLVQTLCPSCKKGWSDVRDSLADDDRRLIEQYCDTQKVSFRNHAGCSAPGCWHGITGRRVIAEVIRPDASFMQFFRYLGKLVARSYWVHHMGGITRGMHLMRYINAGEVDPLDADKFSPLDEDDINLLSPESLKQHLAASPERRVP
ncbi:GspE/PulE family protein [Pantoea dispersa]|uniref:Type II secretion protein E n=1 Tax=Pantoea dispersa TaxID=59814 RepID=A0A8E1V8S0_9GAMM|nr:ATPase, T2SS/T4P/T4SS family [Pantoea dispersa]KTR88285.1 type II secretion protein E [Pantoea dispersa]KTS20684.1 type II secretion protein E [Pantoea dispersa]KTS31115.1 type II secretion protein E [Pantoea dispersa]KTS54212.1 type II secretion protein E [Pantoea dispersa]KTS59698.1 type II secretion protein E [Pantoea dispersa]